MKQAFLLSFVVTLMLCAEETLPPPIAIVKEETELTTKPLTPTLDNLQSFNRRFIPYVKLGPQVGPMDAKATFMPGIGFGFRSESTAYGVDVSFAFASAKYKTADGKKEQAYKAIHPRLLYIKFLKPGAPTTPYYGLGGSWGTVSDGNNTFSGIIADANFGYEFLRDSNIRQMVDLTISQPTLPIYQKGTYFLPSAEISYSLGF